MAANSTTTERRRQRIIDVCSGLPEATAGTRTGQHYKFDVRGRTFAYYVDNEHGDGKIAILVKVIPGEQDVMARSEPERFYVPKYIGHRGWVALRVDLKSIDWDEADHLLRTSYRLVAPKRLATIVTET